MLGRASGRASVCSHPLLSISNQRAPLVRRESSGAVHKSRPAWDNLQREAGMEIQNMYAVHRFFCCHDHYLIWIRLEMNWTSFRSLSTFHVKTLGVNSDFPWTSLHLSLSFSLHSLLSPGPRSVSGPRPLLDLASPSLPHLDRQLGLARFQDWGWGRPLGAGGWEKAIHCKAQGTAKKVAKNPSTQRIQPKVIRLKNISVYLS